MVAGGSWHLWAPCDAASRGKSIHSLIVRRPQTFPYISRQKDVDRSVNPSCTCIEKRPLPSQRCVIRLYNNIQHRGGLPKYAEVTKDGRSCGLGCGLGICLFHC